MIVPNFKQSIYTLFVLAICISCSSPTIQERAQDPWFFRSVIDKQPRMLTLALNKDLYVSYSLQSGNLYKVWKGGVNFDSLDGEPAHIFFLLVAPIDSAGPHLKALARISRLLKDKYFRDNLKKSKNECDVIVS